MIEMILLYALVGLVAGILGGLLGISGGLVTVPSLLFLFTYQHFPQGYDMHLAIGTSLAAMFFNTLSSTLAHNKRKGVQWSLVLPMLPGIIMGAIVGAYIARNLPSDFLEIFFGCFIILLGLYLLLSRINKEMQKEFLKPSPLYSLVGFFVSGISSLIGLGGGVLMVPSLMGFKLKMKKAVGTAAATSLITTLTAALAYLYFGIEITAIPLTWGYIYLPAFIAISITAFLSAPFGAKLVHLVPSSILKKVFGAALIVTGISMFF